MDRRHADGQVSYGRSQQPTQRPPRPGLQARVCAEAGQHAGSCWRHGGRRWGVGAAAEGVTWHDMAGPLQLDTKSRPACKGMHAPTAAAPCLPQSCHRRQVLPGLEPLLDLMGQIARRRGKTLSQVAINWAICQVRAGRMQAAALARHGMGEGMAWHGMVWRTMGLGVAWCSMARHGAAWHSATWTGHAMA